ncbi:FkbM family methyltransferase [Elioraea thermophila]|uniref:FkbM family methyltransferase n=1 Tax=Elioraea thermophila TaxID=2185104 RepID=UPI000DF3DD58|nr:FkbM family methyltransferase [Elioraea thermophila]
MNDSNPSTPAPLVSVIIPTATAPERFPLSLASVLNQTLRDFEVIVVDDDSGADVQAVLDRFGDPRVRLIRHEVRRGRAAACNTGIRAARGRWIAFNDDDDEWLPNHLEVHLAALRESGAEASISRLFMEKLFPALDGELCWPPRLEEVIVFANGASTQCAVFSKQTLQNLGLFDDAPEWWRGEDRDLVARAVMSRTSVTFLDRKTVDYWYSNDRVVARRVRSGTMLERLLFVAIRDWYGTVLGGLRRARRTRLLAKMLIERASGEFDFGSRVSAFGLLARAFLTSPFFTLRWMMRRRDVITRMLARGPLRKRAEAVSYHAPSGAAERQVAPPDVRPLPVTFRERALAAALKAARKVTVQMHRVRGLAGLADTLRRAIGPIPLRVVVHDFDGTLTTDLDLSSELDSRSFWSGYYERWEIAVLKTLLRPGDVFIECGANTGEFTLVAAKAVGPEGRVLAFEPQRQLAERLRRIAARNGLRNVAVEERGLADVEAEATLAIPVGASAEGFSNRGMAGIVTAEHSPFPPGFAARFEIVRTTALDDVLAEHWLDAIHVMKIGVEGAELSLLRGAERTITTHRPALILELNNATTQAAGYAVTDLVAWLEGRGYRLFTIGWRARLAPFRIEDFERSVAREPRHCENVLCLHHADGRRNTLGLA